MRKADGSTLPGFKDSEIRDVAGLKVGIVGLTAEDSPVKSSPGADLVFASTFDTAIAQAAELRKQGADLVVAVAHAKPRPRHAPLPKRRVRHHPLGDDHDLALFFDGKTVLAKSKEEAEFVTAIDVAVDVQEKDGKRSVSWFQISASLTPRR